MKICCVKTEYLPKEITQSTCAKKISIKKLFTNPNAQIAWIERSDAETNFEYKQFISYGILINSKNQIACYPRHGNEKRLHGLYSCSIGGHIDEIDKDKNPSKTIQNGLMRELSEELSNFDKTKVKIKFKGVINEIQSEVGLVHLGIVFLIKCKKNYIPLPAEETKGLEWKTLTQLSECKTELWSKLALSII